jgi:hypothetical protein
MTIEKAIDFFRKNFERNYIEEFLSGENEGKFVSKKKTNEYKLGFQL